MKLNIEISTRRDYYYDDRLRRKMKHAISLAIFDAVQGETSELSSLRFSEPKARKRKVVGS